MVVHVRLSGILEFGTIKFIESERFRKRKLLSLSCEYIVHIYIYICLSFRGQFSKKKKKMAPRIEKIVFHNLI